MQICYRYATIKEEDSINKDITICSGQGIISEDHILLSTSEKVSVVLYTSSDPEEQFHFALKFEGNKMEILQYVLHKIQRLVILLFHVTLAERLLLAYIQ